MKSFFARRQVDIIVQRPYFPFLYFIFYAEFARLRIFSSHLEGEAIFFILDQTDGRVLLEFIRPARFAVASDRRDSLAVRKSHAAERRIAHRHTRVFRGKIRFEHAFGIFFAHSFHDFYI